MMTTMTPSDHAASFVRWRDQMALSVFMRAVAIPRSMFATRGRRIWSGASLRLAPLLFVSGLAGCEQTGPTDGNRVIWRADGQGWGAAAVDAKKVYFLGAGHDVIAVDKASGARRWRSFTGDPGADTFGRSVIVAGGVVVAGDVDIHAFNPSTGAKVWDYYAADRFAQPGSFIMSTDGQTVFAGSFNGKAYALDAARGAVKWIFDLGATTSVVSDPVVSN